MQHEFVPTEPAAGKREQVLAAKFGGEDRFSFPVWWIRLIISGLEGFLQFQLKSRRRKKENLRIVLNWA